MSSGHHDQLVHPGRRHHVDRDAVRSGHQQKVAALSGFEVVDLRLLQVEGSLQLDGLGMFERTEQKDARVGCQDGPILGFEEVAGVLAHQD